MFYFRLLIGGILDLLKRDDYDRALSSDRFNS